MGPTDVTPYVGVLPSPTLEAWRTPNLARLSLRLKILGKEASSRLGRRKAQSLAANTSPIVAWIPEKVQPPSWKSFWDVEKGTRSQQTIQILACEF
jgi:hypothetical protein